MKKKWCLFIAAVILCSNSGFVYAEESAVPETAEVTDIEDVQLFASVDGIMFEYDFSRSTELERYVKVKYNSDYFTSGINEFCVAVSIPSDKVVSVENSTQLSGFDVDSSYSGGIYTVTGKTSRNEKPSDGNLFTIKITLDSNLQSAKTLRLVNGTYIGDNTMKQYLDNGGINGASVALPVKSGQDFIDPSNGTTGTAGWSYSTGVLKIFGSGTMADYKPGEAPWFHGADKITRVEFEGDDVVNIGANAFYGLTALSEVKLSSGIQTIGEGAFEGCGNLRAISMPTNIHTSIGMNAFKNCSSLTAVDIPSGVSLINKGAFEGCTRLSSLTIPFVGSEVGSRNNLNTFDYIFNGNVPSSLKTVTVTNEVSLPEKAFAGCKNISSITVNNEVKTIGASAFDGCSSLRGFNIPSGITSIDDYTFRGCSSAAEITVPDSVQGIGMAAFDGCRALNSVNIPNGITEIKDYTFRNCASLINIVIPDTVENIRKDVLAGCSRLHTIKIPFVGANPNPGMTTITNEGVFGYLFGEGVGVTQGDKDYAIPASVTKVEVTNPGADYYIPMGAFINCANINDIIIDGGNTVLDQAFANCRFLKNLYLSRRIDSIGENILENCTNLVTLTVPFIGTSRQDKDTETSVLGSFFGSGDSKTSNTDVQQYYKSGAYRWYHVPGTLKNVSVLNNTEIPYGAFMNCYHLEQVSLVTGTVVSEHAFYNCTALKNVKLPNNLREIGYEAFAECSSLETVNIPAKTRSIGLYAFYNAENLKDITIPKSVEDIADDVFVGTPFVLNSADDNMELMDVSDVVIRCAAGSKAEEYAKENGLRYVTVDESELDVKLTSTTIDKHSDGTYFFDITDVNNLSGTVIAAVYDSDGAMLNMKSVPAGDINYHIVFTEEEMKNAKTAKVFIWDSLKGLKSEVSEAEVFNIN